jgi:hypothetical protein
MTSMMPTTPVASKRRSATANNSTSTGKLNTTPIRQYFSRRRTTNSHILDLPVNFVGIYSPWALFWGCVFLTVPVAYVYILLVLLRELCVSFPDTIYLPIQTYLPPAGRLIAAMSQSSRLLVEVWCGIEAVFYVCLKLHIQWLQTRDPLEASLSAAPLMELEDRRLLYQRMMDCAKDDPASHITGWFFDEPIASISQYDIRDFTAWSMFEGRNQEHLTSAELEQLEDFVDEVELRISLQMYGPVKPPAQDENENGKGDESESMIGDESESMIGDESDSILIQQENVHQGFDSGTKKESAVARNRPWRDNLPKPKKGECSTVQCVRIVRIHNSHREPKSPKCCSDAPLVV